jgi:hypothetical protein
MGWLFAVARGLQQRSRRAVLGSLLPIAIGQEASIVVAVVVVALTEHFGPRTPSACWRPCCSAAR